MVETTANAPGEDLAYDLLLSFETTKLKHITAERDRLAATIARIEALLPDADDPYVHVHPLPGGEPDCGGCWDADIRQAIRGESCLSLHRTEAGWPDCSTCGGGCPDCTDQS